MLWEGKGQKLSLARDGDCESTMQMAESKSTTQKRNISWESQKMQHAEKG